MQIFIRGAAELIPLELENDDTVQDIRVCQLLRNLLQLISVFS